VGISLELNSVPKLLRNQPFRFNGLPHWLFNLQSLDHIITFVMVERKINGLRREGVGQKMSLSEADIIPQTRAGKRG